MTILEGAFPETISPEVKALLQEFFHLSNAASSHNEHEASMLISLLPFQHIMQSWLRYTQTRRSSQSSSRKMVHTNSRKSKTKPVQVILHCHISNWCILPRFCSNWILKQFFPFFQKPFLYISPANPSHYKPSSPFAKNCSRASRTVIT